MEEVIFTFTVSDINRYPDSINNINCILNTQTPAVDAQTEYKRSSAYTLRQFAQWKMISNVFFRSNYYSDGSIVFVWNDDGMGNFASSPRYRLFTLTSTSIFAIMLELLLLLMVHLDNVLCLSRSGGFSLLLLRWLKLNIFIQLWWGRDAMMLPSTA